MVENPFFRKLIEFINRVFIDYLPSSGNTIRKWILEEHERQKTLKKDIILKARSRITISFNTWTSPFSKKHVLSVIAHFIDENWKRRYLQLSMCRLYGGHSDENLAHHIIPVLRMLKRALKLKLRFQAFCENWKPDRKPKSKDDERYKDDDDDYDLSEDKLSTEEWQGVEEVLQLLRLLKRLTKRAERRDTSLEDYVPACDMIIGHLYEASQRFKRLSDTANNESEAQMYEWLHISAEAAWDKANALYKKVDDSPAYYAALTMDPRYKFEWFEQRWGSNPTKREWLQGAKAVVREHWQKYRSRHHSQDSNSTSQRPQKAQVLTRNLNDDDEFDTEEHLRISYDRGLQKIDEFGEYIATAPDPLHDLPQWMLIELKHPALAQSRRAKPLRLVLA